MAAGPGGRTRRLTRFAMLVAMAVVLHVVEGMFPPPIPVPGAKLGLANIAGLVCLDAIGLRPALLLTLLRTTLGSLITGSFLGFGFLLSFGAGAVSMVAMGLLKHLGGRRFSLVGISLLGALVHNITQLAIAALIVRNVGILGYLPYMLLGSLPTGAATGVAAYAALETQGSALRRWLAGAVSTASGAEADGTGR